MKIPPHLRLTGTNIVGMAASAIAGTLIDIGMAHLRKALEPQPSRSYDPPTVIYIYGLVDPRTNQVRYIGASLDPWRRRSEHLSEARSSSQTPKALWLRDLLCAGLEPSLTILARTTRSTWRSVEEKWIASYSDLTNSGGTRPETPEIDEP
jgi:hypothetical protein